MTRKGRLNWVKKHVAITTLQKWVFDKLRKYEKRFGSDLFNDMLVAYMKNVSAGSLNEMNFYHELKKEWKEKQSNQ